MIECLDAILAEDGRGEKGGVSWRHSGMCASDLGRFAGNRHRLLRETRNDEIDYGRKIAAPVVARLSSSICALAASFSA